MGRELPDSEQLAEIRADDRSMHYRKKLKEKKEKKQALADTRLRNIRKMEKDNELNCCDDKEDKKAKIDEMKDALVGLLSADIQKKMFTASPNN